MHPGPEGTRGLAQALSPAAGGPWANTSSLWSHFPFLLNGAHQGHAGPGWAALRTSNNVSCNNDTIVQVIYEICLAVGMWEARSVCSHLVVELTLGGRVLLPS